MPRTSNADESEKLMATQKISYGLQTPGEPGEKIDPDLYR
jgi:hypothetical protein